MAGISIKQGAALVLQLAAYDDQGTAFNLAGVTASAQVRDAQNNLVATLPIVAGGDINLLGITVPATTGWPIGLLRCDIKLLVAGLPAISETFSISVQQAVTQ